MNKKQKEIDHEIMGYNPKPSIVKGMRKLGKLGFSFSGHGYGFGGEDFNLIKRSTYVNFCDTGKKVVVSISQGILREDGGKEVFKGSVPKALAFLTQGT